ncbi:MAG: hypothetical protein EBR01_07580 [Proteobacteria bacterium]|nr:hypothetical protein [Pseudomonadota bacterium]
MNLNALYCSVLSLIRLLTILFQIEYCQLEMDFAILEQLQYFRREFLFGTLTDFVVHFHLIVLLPLL